MVGSGMFRFGKAGEAWICRERKGEAWPGPVRQGRRGMDGRVADGCGWDC